MSACRWAAVIQGPNRLSPERHPDRAKGRRDWVLGRLLELGWAGPAEVAAAQAAPLGLRRSAPERPPARDLLAWVDAGAEDLAPKRREKGRGAVVETGVDP